MDKFKNKYRISSSRLKHWNYGSNGAYFITICTKNREHFFGEIIDNNMQINDVGQLAEKFWCEIPNHFSFVKLGNFVVMPNHTHGILIIDKIESVDIVKSKNIINNRNSVETPKLDVSTAIPNSNKNGGKNEKWQSNTIGSIINQYKRIVTIHARKINSDFAWQSRFHDHIIRDSASFERVKTYIECNPENWQLTNFIHKT